ncbi:MAG TPA: hypothetical protein VFX98_01715 [Longimicrobiaceae bacterium]|nr:hypothetical protein [Longimicrobiaceae bacterium]
MRSSAAVLLLAAAAACAAPQPAPDVPETVQGPVTVQTPAPRSGEVNPVGNFEFTTEVNGQPMRGNIHITGAPGAYTGRVTADIMSEIPISSVSVAGQQLTVVADTPDGAVTIVLNFQGDNFTGNWSLGGQGGAVTGRRVS